MLESDVILKLHTVPESAQAPLQPPKPAPESGVAVSVTPWPYLKLALQFPGSRCPSR